MRHVAVWCPLERVHAVFSPAAALRRGTALMAAGKTGPAFQLYARAGRTGLAEAEYRVGRCYLDGVGVPPSRAEGIRWLERAADHGHVEAQSQLAIIYLHGAAGAPTPKSAARLFDVGGIADPNYVMAMQRARMAAEANSGEAQALLAFILSSGPRDMRDLDEADLWYERSAATGCPQGMLGHALALNRKSGGETAQREVALQLLGKAAEAGLPAALYALGVINEGGFGMTSNEPAAAEFYRRAAEKGHRSGQARWGKALIHGIGVDANPSDGETWLRRAAIAGDPEAAAALGDLHANGGNSPPNHAEAASWFRRAADAGHKGAARSLGLLYFSGAGVPYDPERGMQWLRISAAAGDGPARSEFGNLLLSGMGEDDRVLIYKGFEQAAASGDLMAAYNCAVCLSLGVGVVRDDRQAALWLRKAADRIPNAQLWYGRMLIEGRGVNRDLAEGRKWIERAVEAGMVDAQVALGEMMLTGTGGTCDPPGALALFEKAAVEGHLAAMFAAGIVYEGAHGVPANHDAAQYWFRIAAKYGHPAAQMMLERYIAASATHQAEPNNVDHSSGEGPAEGPNEVDKDVTTPSTDGHRRRDDTHLG